MVYGDSTKAYHCQRLLRDTGYQMVCYSEKGELSGNIVVC